MDNGTLILIVVIIVTVMIIVTLLVLKNAGYLTKTTGSTGGSGTGTHVAPSTPTNLSTTNIGLASIGLSWTGIVGATGYTIQYQVSGQSSWTLFGSTAYTNSTVSGLNPATSYNFQLVATNSYGNSSPATLSNITTGNLPSTPSNLTSSAVTSSSMTLSWTPVAGANLYNILYQVSTAQNWSNFGNSIGTSVTITGLNANTSYDFQVLAVNNYGSSNPAIINNIQTSNVNTSGGSPPLAPTNLKAGTITSTQVPLSWTASTNTTNYLVSYQLNGYTTTWTNFTSTANTSVIVTGLSGGEVYNFQIIATNSYGTSPSVTLDGVSTPYPTVNPGPNAPTGLQISSMTSNKVSLTWNASPGATSYTVLYQINGSTTWTTLSPTTTLQATVTGLGSGNQYNFAVTANNANGVSNPSNIASTGPL
jgi:fibronectin type 3 domain-containing protein